MRFFGFGLVLLASRVVSGAVCSDYGGIPIEVDGFEQVCCASSCEPCGGSGCSSDDGGAQSCCADGITNAGKICSGDADAPCLMSPAPSACAAYGGITTEIEGYEDVCCSSSCEYCGGSGCSGNTGGASSCCVGTVTKADNMCSEDTDAPCLLSPTLAATETTPSPTTAPETGACSAYGGITTEIEGYEDVCCSSSCEYCGGGGCNRNTGGASSCCVGTVTRAGNMCSEDTDAPCLLSSTPEPVQTPAPTTASAAAEACRGYGGITTEIEGYEDVCCSSSCEYCGGTGCNRNTGGASSCCVGTVTRAGNMCSGDTDAPCLLSPDEVEQACDMSTLSDAAKEQLSIYDKSIYVEPDCVDSATPLPVHCNQMNLGQECRGCYLTCEGARKYIEDFAGEIDEWGEDAIIHFCDDADVGSLEECP